MNADSLKPLTISTPHITATEDMSVSTVVSTGKITGNKTRVIYISEKYGRQQLIGFVKYAGNKARKYLFYPAMSQVPNDFHAPLDDFTLTEIALVVRYMNDCMRQGFLNPSNWNPVTTRSSHLGERKDG